MLLLLTQYSSEDNFGVGCCYLSAINSASGRNVAINCWGGNGGGGVLPSSLFADIST